MGRAFHRNDKTSRRDKAFTLIELLVVVAIIGVLMGLVAGLAVFAKRKAMEAKARTELNLIAELVEKHRLSHGKYPVYGDVRALMKKMEANGERLPEGADEVDPWGNDYIYKCEQNKHFVYELYSRGHDGNDKNESCK